MEKEDTGNWLYDRYLRYIPLFTSCKPWSDKEFLTRVTFGSIFITVASFLTMLGLDLYNSNIIFEISYFDVKSFTIWPSAMFFTLGILILAHAFGRWPNEFTVIFILIGTTSLHGFWLMCFYWPGSTPDQITDALSGWIWGGGKDLFSGVILPIVILWLIISMVIRGNKSYYKTINQMEDEQHSDKND